MLNSVLGSMLSISRRKFSTIASASSTAPPIVLFQYHICPFCNRVKAFLDYQKLPYVAIEVNPLTKAEIIEFQHKQVPIAQIDDNPVFGSDKIIHELLQKGRNDFQHQNESKDPWVDFAISKLAVLLYPNMCRSWNDSYRAFDYVNQIPSFGPIQRILIQNIGSLAMFFAASKVKKKHNIKDERKALEDVLKVLEGELQKSDFLSKSKTPDLGDLAVFGTLCSIEGLAVFHNALGHHPAILAWYERMRKLTPSQKIA